MEREHKLSLEKNLDLLARKLDIDSVVHYLRTKIVGYIPFLTEQDVQLIENPMITRSQKTTKLISILKSSGSSNAFDYLMEALDHVGQKWLIPVLCPDYQIVTFENDLLPLTKEQENILDKNLLQYCDIIETIPIMGSLMSDGVITNYDFDRVQAKQTDHDKNAQLVALIKMKDQKAFKCFLEEVERYETPIENRMTKRETDELDKYISEFCNNRNTKHILVYLSSKGVFNERNLEIVKAKKTSYEMNLEIVKIVKRKDRKAFDLFFNAIKYAEEKVKSENEIRAKKINGILDSFTQKLRHYYKTEFSNIRLFDDRFVSINDIWVNLSLTSNGDVGETYGEMLFSALCDNHPIVVIGNPGIGKSTLIKRICYDWASDENNIFNTNYSIVLPVIFRDASFGQDVLETALKSLAYKAEIKPLTKSILSKGKRILILFDGYDEIASDKKTDIIFNKKKLSTSTKFDILITTREFKVNTISFQHSKLFIRGFDERQQAIFISRCLLSDPNILEMVNKRLEEKEIDESEKSEKFKEKIEISRVLNNNVLFDEILPIFLSFIDEIKADQKMFFNFLYDSFCSIINLKGEFKNIRYLFEIPLLLHMIYLVHQYKEISSGSETEIYLKFVGWMQFHALNKNYTEKDNALLGENWIEQREIDILGKLSLENLYIHNYGDEGTLIFDGQKIFKFDEKKILTKIGLLIERQKNIAKSSHILKSTVEFPHKTFQEFLAAIHLKRELEKFGYSFESDSLLSFSRYLKESPHRGCMDQVLLFLIGLVSEEEKESVKMSKLLFDCNILYASEEQIMKHGLFSSGYGIGVSLSQYESFSHEAKWLKSDINQAAKILIISGDIREYKKLLSANHSMDFTDVFLYSPLINRFEFQNQNKINWTYCVIFSEELIDYLGRLKTKVNPSNELHFCRMDIFLKKSQRTFKNHKESNQSESIKVENLVLRFLWNENNELPSIEETTGIIEAIFQTFTPTRLLYIQIGNDIFKEYSQYYGIMCQQLIDKIPTGIESLVILNLFLTSDSNTNPLLELLCQKISQMENLRLFLTNNYGEISLKSLIKILENLEKSWLKMEYLVIAEFIFEKEINEDFIREWNHLMSLVGKFQNLKTLYFPFPPKSIMSIGENSQKSLKQVFLDDVLKGKWPLLREIGNFNDYDPFDDGMVAELQERVKERGRRENQPLTQDITVLNWDRNYFESLEFYEDNYLKYLVNL